MIFGRLDACNLGRELGFCLTFSTWQWQAAVASGPLQVFNLALGREDTHDLVLRSPLTLQSLDVPRTPSIYRYTNSDGYVIPHSALFSSTSSSPIGGHQDAPQPVPHQTSQRQSNFSDGSGPLFNMYVKMAEEEDDKMADLWQKDAKTILIFVSSPINFPTAIVVQQLT